MLSSISFFRWSCMFRRQFLQVYLRRDTCMSLIKVSPSYCDKDGVVCYTNSTSPRESDMTRWSDSSRSIPSSQLITMKVVVSCSNVLTWGLMIELIRS